MDYHSDRFADCSVLLKEKNRTIACFPANYNSAEKRIYSHQGLTYGGLLMGMKMTAVQVLEAFRIISDYYRSRFDVKSMVYKPIPYIYAKYPSEEELYALFRMSAQLVSRGLSSTISLSSPLGLVESRKSGLRKACREGLDFVSDGNLETFWNILDEVLYDCHSLHPVHSVEELKLLCRRFPDTIRLFSVLSSDGEMLAGTLVFDFGDVVHTQYIAANKRGKASGALDLLISKLILEVYSDRKYFDFGISTECGGTILNEGLIFQKEGFGGRGVCYDIYEIPL
ncbi:MAG: GNAT family N-acetyltransferase [Bacteroides sp.]|nr:GNAT family N-acetyltransferase [Bacteroides sp.]